MSNGLTPVPRWPLTGIARAHADDGVALFRADEEIVYVRQTPHDEPVLMPVASEAALDALEHAADGCLVRRVSVSPPVYAIIY